MHSVGVCSLSFPFHTLLDLVCTPTLGNARLCRTKFKFYEKPSVGNRVMNRNTALPTSCIRASLLQETVRRLTNSSTDISTETRTEILNKFASKLVNSGHSHQSSRIIMVQGVTKYLHNLKLSRLPEQDPNFVPLYLSRQYRETERQCEKKMAKTNWFKERKKSKKSGSWKDNLVGVWKGNSQSQKRVENMDYSTILRVPNTRNSQLLNNLIKHETRLAKITGYNVKLVESSGVQLARLLQKNFSTKKCHWEDCAACADNDEKMGSRCRLSNVVYEGVCLDCVDECENGKRTEKEVGRYVGESGRTLAERSSEHAHGTKSIDADNFIVKHWVLQHSELDRRPKIKFKVLKAYKDPLSRMIAESVLIDKVSNLNSKSEWRNNKMCRLVVETKSWEREKEKSRLKEEEENTDMLRKLDELKKRVTREEDTEKTCQAAKRSDSVPLASMVKMKKRNSRDPGDDGKIQIETRAKKRKTSGIGKPKRRDSIRLGLTEEKDSLNRI